jgi:hypothetical protein
MIQSFFKIALLSSLTCLLSSAWTPSLSKGDSRNASSFNFSKQRRILPRPYDPFYSHQQRRKPFLHILFATEKDSPKKDTDDANTEWGISYIGGDPCGSKYNEDPFSGSNNKSFKPGFPDDMKARIEALAKKRKEMEEKST